MCPMMVVSACVAVFRCGCGQKAKPPVGTFCAAGANWKVPVELVVGATD